MTAEDDFIESFDAANAIDGKVEGAIEGEDIQRIAVDNFSAAFGQVVDAISRDSYDVMYLQAEMQDGSKRQLLFSSGHVQELMELAGGWLKFLTAGEGECTCGTIHTSESSHSKEIIDNIDRMGDVIRHIKEEIQDDGIW